MKYFYSNIVVKTRMIPTHLWSQEFINSDWFWFNFKIFRIKIKIEMSYLKQNFFLIVRCEDKLQKEVYVLNISYVSKFQVKILRLFTLKFWVLGFAIIKRKYVLKSNQSLLFCTLIKRMMHSWTNCEISINKNNKCIHQF